MIEKERCIRFLDGATTKTEFPFSQMTGVKLDPENPTNGLVLKFSGGARDYSVKFAQAKDMEAFTQITNKVITPPARTGAGAALGAAKSSWVALPANLDLASKAQREELSKVHTPLHAPPPPPPARRLLLSRANHALCLCCCTDARPIRLR